MNPYLNKDQIEVGVDEILSTKQQIVGFKHEDPRNYAFNADKTKGDLDDLIYVPTNENFTKKYPYNFITYKNDSDFLHVNGQSDLKELRNLVKFKKLLEKIKSRYFRKSVIPAFVGLYESGKSGTALVDEAKSLAEILSGIENGAGVALPNVKQIVASSSIIFS